MFAVCNRDILFGEVFPELEEKGLRKAKEVYARKGDIFISRGNYPKGKRVWNRVSIQNRSVVGENIPSSAVNMTHTHDGE